MDRAPLDLFAASELALSVGELAGRVRELLEKNFSLLRVIGEVTDLSLASSGHAYFALRDEKAVFPAVMFRGALARLGGAMPPEGTEVECLGRLTLYEPRGRAQLVAEWLAPRGAGALSIQMLHLRARLQAEGLFDPARKRPLPRFPRRIAVVTSPHGAALQDILRVLSARFPAAEVVLGGVRVQGDGAARQIAAMVRRLGDGRHGEVLILARGGGSREDLSAFNDEVVVRAVAACAVPVVSAVGHETDVVLSDLAADWRAPTPSAAAAAVVPDRAELLSLLEQNRSRLALALRRTLAQARSCLLGRQGRLRDPRLSLAAQRIRLDEAREALRRAGDGVLRRAGQRQTALERRLRARDPRLALARARRDAAEARQRLRAGFAARLSAHRARLLGLAGRLRGLDPAAVLERGFALVTGADGSILRDSRRAKPGDPLRIRLHRGGLRTRVEAVEDAAPPAPLPDGATGGGRHGGKP